MRTLNPNRTTLWIATFTLIALAVFGGCEAALAVLHRMGAL